MNGKMQYRILPPPIHLILDALVATVLLTILGLTLLFLIQALVDCVFCPRAHSQLALARTGDAARLAGAGRLLQSEFLSIACLCQRVMRSRWLAIIGIRRDCRLNFCCRNYPRFTKTIL